MENKQTPTYKLLSLPPDLVEHFNSLENLPRREWFCSTDPAGRKVGSGGGTAWLLEQWLASDSEASLSAPKIIIHAGGQSRRLPSYAPVGKILTPVPVFRWARGQKLDQNLLSLQMPLYERILEEAPAGLSTLIASGDVLVRAGQGDLRVPEADVVCYGIWVDSELATHHGVFASRRDNQERLDFMLQKPSIAELESLSGSHLFLMDIGIWVLSERAVRLLMSRSQSADGGIGYYDLYSDFGRALGEHPSVDDPEIASLSVAVVPLHDGEFYHFGTSRELISSTLALQHRVLDQRKILQRKIKASPALFVQNALMGYRLSSANDRVWVENSNVPASWSLTSDHIITGVPVNDWTLTLPSGICLDVVPVGEAEWAVRPYGIDDPMRGPLGDQSTVWLGSDYRSWASARELDVCEPGMPDTSADIQSAEIYPVVGTVDEIGEVVRWMVADPASRRGREIWLGARRLSADGLSANANLERLYKQRLEFRRDNWTYLAGNYELSVFYQLDLADVAENYVALGLAAPKELGADVPAMTRIRNRMLRSRIASLSGADGATDESEAFGLLRSEVLGQIMCDDPRPRLSVYPDQIVWGRSSVRIDLAGGWTDTPPYSLYEGGNVVNMAIELNGQPPLQVYVKPCKELRIVLRSIDLGAMEVIETFGQLSEYHTVGSPFSIPKAALTLAGFVEGRWPSLADALADFGSGIEVTLLSAIPAGSGLGTSSILGATVLGALSDFCGLGWSRNEICRRTLALEQLLTTGGGWQDQYGGVLPGIKLLQTGEGYDQRPIVSWLPQQIFTAPELRPCHLLYYTGITRTAKGILAEIVRGMFLNSGPHLSLLGEMKSHALEMAGTIQRGNFEEYGRMIARTWNQNRRLDPGTEPEAVAEMVRRVSDWTLGCKLPGAGGGGYLYMVAKDAEAAARIRAEFTKYPPNPRARFVEMQLSDTGFQVSRS